MNSFIRKTISHEKPNERIKMYEGSFELEYKGKQVSIEGLIAFQWFPTIGGYFTGKIKNKIDRKFDEFWKVGRIYKLQKDTSIIGEFKITNLRCSGFPNQKLVEDIQGVSFSECVLGDKNIEVNKVTFCISNMRDYKGGVVKYNSGEIVYQGEIKLTTTKFSIRIHKHYEHKSRYNDLKNSGGYFINYYGEITPFNNKASIGISKIKELTEALNVFLSFLNGRRIALILFEGVFEEEVTWVDFSPQKIHPFKPCVSVFKSQDIEGLDDIWKEFWSKWEDIQTRNFLKTLIHWYLEANYLAGDIEGSLIIAQTALELLYNYIVVEQKKIILGKDSENINAANKIRILLSQIQVDNYIPIRLKNLNNFIKTIKILKMGQVFLLKLEMQLYTQITTKELNYI